MCVNARAPFVPPERWGGLRPPPNPPLRFMRGLRPLKLPRQSDSPKPPPPHPTNRQGGVRGEARPGGAQTWV